MAMFDESLANFTIGEMVGSDPIMAMFDDNLTNFTLPGTKKGG